MEKSQRQSFEHRGVVKSAGGGRECYKLREDVALGKNVMN